MSTSGAPQAPGSVTSSPPWQPVWDQLVAAFPGRADEPVPVDATDRLLLAESADAAETAGAGGVVVIDDRFGALTLGASALLAAGSRSVQADAGRAVAPIRVHQDDIAATARLRHAAGACARTEAFAVYPRLSTLGLLKGARVVLVVLPRSLAALREIAESVAAHASPDVTVFAGGHVKHMTPAMNDVLRESFSHVRASLARGKSRVLVASGPRPPTRLTYPVTTATDVGPVVAHGGAFAGASLDLGTRALFAALDASDAAQGVTPGAGGPGSYGLRDPVRTVVDLGCGTGLLAAWAARRWPDAEVWATDSSAAAVESTALTAVAHDAADRVTTLQADAGAGIPDDTADLVLCNPPFHQGAALRTDGAHRMFEAAGRLLRPGGTAWFVWNSHLRYRPALERAIGPTAQAYRDRRFTVTVSRLAGPTTS